MCTCLLLLACGPDHLSVVLPDDGSGAWPDERASTTDPIGRSWYVGLKGSDGAKGTLEAPLRTLTRAVALAGPGDVIRVLPGTYGEELVLDSGSPRAAAITLRGEGTSRPVIAPGARDQSAVLLVRGRWNLENLTIDVSGQRMFAVVFEKGSNQSVLSDSELKGGTSGSGVLVDGAEGITLRRNLIHHFIRSGDDSHGVTVVGPSRDIVIQDNEIHHNSGDSIQCQAGTAPARSILIQGNTLHDEGENGVDIKQCDDVTVRGNTLGGFPNTAVRSVGSSAGEAVVIHQSARRVIIQDNEISRVGRGVSVLCDGAPPEDVRVEDNHFQTIRNMPAGNGQGIRIECARNATVVNNILEDTASYGLMLAADGKVVTGLDVRNNTVKGRANALLLRLGQERFRPGIWLADNHYSPDGVLRADGVAEKLGGTNARYQGDFSGEQLTLSSAAKLDVWRLVTGVDQGSGLVP